MDLRSYTKQELALLYFPDAAPAVASAHLMRWIQRIPDLLQKLAATGYGKNCKEFTPIFAIRCQKGSIYFSQTCNILICRQVTSKLNVYTQHSDDQ